MKKTIGTVLTTAVLLAAFWITGTMGVVTNKIIAYRESSTPFTAPQTIQTTGATTGLTIKSTGANVARVLLDATDGGGKSWALGSFTSGYWGLSNATNGNTPFLVNPDAPNLSVQIDNRGILQATSGVGSPLKASADSTMDDPSTAPTVVTSATSNINCTNAVSRTYYTAWVNPGGVSALSPVSVAWVPSPSSRKPTVTLQSTPPSNAVGWLLYVQINGAGSLFLQDDVSTTPTTLELGFNPLGSTTLTFNCTASSMTYAAAQGLNCTGSGVPRSCCTGSGTGTCTAGPRDYATINALGFGILGFATKAGGNIDLITENARRMTVTANVPTWYNGTTTNNMAIKNVKILTMCPAAGDCDYTTVASFCSANTSTPSVPLLLLVGPGLYQPGVTQACSGQDGLTIWGSGPNTSVIDVVGVTNGFALDLGTTKNISVRDIGLRGVRGVNWTLVGTGGGKSYFQNVDFYSDDNGATNGDCLLYGSAGGGGAVAGSELHLIENRCSFNTDGVTSLDDANTAWYMRVNVFTHSVAPSSSRFSAVSLFSIPCIFQSVGDTFSLDSTPTGSHSGANIGNNAYLFDGGSSTSCATPTSLSIRAASIYINDKTANGTNADATGIRITTAATEAASLTVTGGTTISVNMPNDSGNGNARGIYSENATTVTSLYGTRIRTTGGQAGTRLDLDGNVVGSFLVGPDSDWLTDDGNVTGGRGLYTQGANITAAATITLPAVGDFFVVTGNTNITSVTASWPGRIATLEFTGTPTFTDGSNLKLNSNLVATADDTITIRCDGTNYFEVARSVN